MLARMCRVLLFTAAGLAGLEHRAVAQSESPVVPTLADPAAVLMAPILSQSLRPNLRPGDRPSSLEQPRTEPAARLSPVGNGGNVRVSDFNSAKRDAADLPDSGGRSRTAAVDDPFDYLSNGKLKRSGEGRLVRNPRMDDDDLKSRRSDQLGDKIDDILGGGRGGGRSLFKSDCEFNNFISPVTNPFLFEDPRSLTELRPIAIYQKIPGGAGLFQGGSAWFVGLQGRLAITDRFSVVINKLGASGFNPGSGSTLTDGFGLSEIHLGPKYIFYRDADTKTLLTVGGTFQIPVGSSKVFQDTGKLSIVPYLSGGRRLFDTKFGTLNGLASSGYSFSLNRSRSDYFYASGHLDFDVGNKGKFFPLVEMNWLRYTTDGTTRDLGVEGRDLANFGSPRKGTGLLTVAAGARYKPSDRWEFGGAFELPLTGSRDAFQYRITLDLIWRY